MLLRIGVGEQPTLLTEIGAKADTEFSPEMNIFCHHMAPKNQIPSITIIQPNTTLGMEINVFCHGKHSSSFCFLI